MPDLAEIKQWREAWRQRDPVLDIAALTRIFAELKLVICAGPLAHS
jgi:hypothetical protein